MDTVFYKTKSQNVQPYNVNTGHEDRKPDFHRRKWTRFSTRRGIRMCNHLVSKLYAETEVRPSKKDENADDILQDEKSECATI